MPLEQRISLTKKLQKIVGSLLWLSMGTRPDLCTVTSLLAQNQSNPSPGHLSAAKYVLRYLAGTSSLGISFHTNQQLTLQSVVHFPL